MVLFDSAFRYREKVMATSVERKKLRESFRQEALRSWEEYRETGLHLTLEEVAAWLGTWGTEEKTDVPERNE